MTNIIGTLPDNLQNGTEADASQVMANLNFIVNQVNAGAVAQADLPSDMQNNIAKGSFLGVQTFAAVGTSTYTPNADATKALVIVVGGGGAGGGTVSGPSSNTAGSGGNAGSFGVGFWSTPTSQTITVGNGGGGVAGANGANGGASSIGSLLSAPGGNGGLVGPSTGPVWHGPALNAGPAFAGISALWGSSGAQGFGATLQQTGGTGAASILSPGAVGQLAGVQPASAPSYGAGGAGVASNSGAGAGTGSNAGGGYVAIFEFA